MADMSGECEMSLAVVLWHFGMTWYLARISASLCSLSFGDASSTLPGPLFASVPAGRDPSLQTHFEEHGFCGSAPERWLRVS